MQFGGINYIAVIVAVIAAFAVGSVYYGVNAKRWMKAVKIPEGTEPKMEPSLLVITFVCEIVLAIMMAGVIGHLGDGQVTLYNGIVSGFFLWLGIIMPTMTINNRYQDFGWDLTIIDGIHWLVVVVVMGGIIGWFGV
ncbi:DUF1761 domain-containing protein [Lentilitoribacter sp. EG35]|uniref:DUF1761 domain-containing protein n=1 Tax=Lentilitoribacter sp. EG35 TaxID=3234192 RepID=UPI00346034AE